MKSLKAFVLSCLLLASSATIFAAEFSVRILPFYDFAIQSPFKVVAGGTVSLDLSAVTIRSRDELIFSLQGTPIFMNAPGIETVYFFDVGGAVGYNFRVNDRISVSGEVNGGIWFFPENKKMNLEGASSLSVGGRVAANYYISPSLKASVFTGYKNFLYKPSNFLQGVELGLGISINLTKGLFGSDGIKVDSYDTAPLFPIFYAHYDNDSFGSVTFTNIEKNDITDVEISVYIEQFMSVPKVVGSFDRIKPGEEFSAELTAFLNESIMNQMQNQLSDAVVTVSYKSLGKSSSFENHFFLQTLTRNSMSWEDDRRAAAFVSAKDGAVQRFSRQITLGLRDKVEKVSNPNNLYARAVFEVLKSYGINYVIDPSSVFSTSDTVAVDFLQFPYQTLLYHGGDCDDLSILNCALLEALGVQTAFITIPGHIYMAFDSGYTSTADADRQYGKDKYIVQDGKIWIPFEITVPQDSFDLGLKLGIRQWNKYPNDHLLIPVEDSWKEYKPVTVPESDVSVSFPKDALKKVQ